MTLDNTKILNEILIEWDSTPVKDNGIIDYEKTKKAISLLSPEKIKRQILKSNLLKEYLNQKDGTEGIDYILGFDDILHILSLFNIKYYAYKDPSKIGADMCRVNLPMNYCRQFVKDQQKILGKIDYKIIEFSVYTPLPGINPEGTDVAYISSIKSICRPGSTGNYIFFDIKDCEFFRSYFGSKYGLTTIQRESDSTSTYPAQSFTINSESEEFNVLCGFICSVLKIYEEFGEPTDKDD